MAAAVDLTGSWPTLATIAEAERDVRRTRHVVAARIVPRELTELRFGDGHPAALLEESRPCGRLFSWPATERYFVRVYSAA